VLNDDFIHQHELDGQTIMCTDYQFYLMQRASEIRDEILEEHPVLTESALKEMIENIMKKRRYINGPLNEEIGDLEINLKKELDAEYEKLKAEKVKEEPDETEEVSTEIQTESTEEMK